MTSARKKPKQKASPGPVTRPESVLTQLGIIGMDSIEPAILGALIGDLVTFREFEFLVGTSPQKWRSGVKHDAAAVMEFSRETRFGKPGKQKECQC